MTDKQAMAMALDALNSMKEALAEHEEPTTFNEDEAITAIKEALAQPEQEPVIDKSAAIRIATALGWTPPKENT
jgi:transposase-like protein